MTEKYGFIYVWYDKLYKRYYVGRHWGTENDGYICSSNSMRDAHRRRPDDFKRRIVAKIFDSKETLIIEEQRWLNMIDPQECGKKYYNKTLKSSSPSMRGRKHSPETIEKMRNAATNRKHSEETKEKLRLLNLGKKHSEETKKKISSNNNRDYNDPEFRRKMSEAAKNRSPETRKKISENSKRLHAEGKIGMRGKRHSVETLAKMSKSQIKILVINK